MWLLDMDRRIIEHVVEPVMAQLYYRFGVTNFAAAWPPLAIWYGLLVAQLVQSFVHNGTTFEKCLRAAIVLMCGVTVWYRIDIVHRCEQGVARTGANMEKHLFPSQLQRIWFVAVQIVDIATGPNLGTLAWCSYTVHLYVSACDKPPPKVVKESAWEPDALPEAA